MTDREELEIAVKALDSKKAKNITALKVDDLTILANYFVIASASSTTQVKALADEVEYQLGEKGVKPKGIEGYQSKEWIVLTTMISSCTYSWRRPATSISSSAFGQTVRRSTFPVSLRIDN